MRPARLLLLLALLAALAVTGVARGEIAREGNVMVTFDGGISPHALPRSETAPVSVSVESRFRAVDGSQKPSQLREIRVEINREGRIFDRGLPTCKVRRIQPATIRAAQRICGDAIVGRGRVEVMVHIENQQPFLFKGPMLVFNAKRVNGERRLLAQVYGRRPPSAFVLTFKVSRQSGTFGNVISTTLPKIARKWAYVTYFQMKLHRTYSFRGERHSYLNAACGALDGLSVGIYPFAKGTFKFDGNQPVTTSLIRECRVRD